ncbi:Bcr/CflA family multidrug efflux MFS transporter [Roseomonas sp. NAR14]|uniref:Bcr/CflA family efflux transporter n=1 Tax=Roseomonas acroporae TaxID=2937791 RepID=A0A9X1Y574_9PROT|nr:Bcr/CflA family multidrug efflux MFS transporter [Roseomonas acroporae]MCK8783337.1 Bcr/CflA family multidrug efflux MFS transporter [Roseomonas acroporae]
MSGLLHDRDDAAAAPERPPAAATAASAPRLPAEAGSPRVVAVLSLLMAFASMSTDIYLPAFPALGADLGVSPGRIQLTLSGFLVGFSLGQLLWGPIGDRYGRRGPIAAGLVLFVLGSAGCALAGSAAEVIGWRVVQAVGACAGPVLARAMVRDLYARDRSAQVLSTLMLVMGIAPLLGPILGGQILEWWSWRGIFWVLVLFGLVALACLPLLPETLPPPLRSSLGLRESLFSYVAMARSRRLLGYALMGGCFYGGIYAYLAGTPFAYIEYHHVPATAYGLLFGVNIAGMMIANLINRRLVARFGSDRLLRVGALVAAASGIAVAVCARTGWGGLYGLVVPLFFYVSMLGFIVANSVAGALAAFPRKAGAASALVGATHYGSGVFSAAALGWFADGTPWTMAWMIAVLGVGTLLACLLLLRPARPEMA